MLPLNRVAAWFVAQLCPPSCYKDIRKLLLKQFTLFDRMMMYEAMTSRYFNPYHMWQLALCEQPAMAPHLRNRYHIDSISYAIPMRIPVNSIATMMYAFNVAGCMREWVEDCAKVGFDDPFMFVLNNTRAIGLHYNHRPYTAYELARWAISSKSLSCLQACYAMDYRILEHDHQPFDCVQGTWLWLMQHGAELTYNYKTRILKCIAESPENGEKLLSYLIHPMTIKEIVGEAVGKGELLDWIHARMSVDEMLECEWDEVYTMCVKSVKWFISKGVNLTQLRNYRQESVKYVYPIASPSERARMLANDTSVLYWYKSKLKQGNRKYDLKYDRVLFLQMASVENIQKVDRMEAKYNGVYP